MLTLLTALTSLFSLPGWRKSLGGFPALSGSGWFLLKALVLLVAAVWILGESVEPTAGTYPRERVCRQFSNAARHSDNSCLA